MDSQHEAGIKITGDAQSAVEAHRQVADEQKKLADQTQRTNETSRAASEESRRFVDRLKEQAEQLGKTRAELERYRSSKLQLSEEQRRQVDGSIAQIEAYDRTRQSLVAATGATQGFTAANTAAMSVVRGVAGLLAGGLVGALATAALSFVSFGAAAEGAATRSEESARRVAEAWRPDKVGQDQEMQRVRKLQLELATLRTQADVGDVGFGPAPSDSRAVRDKERELAELTQRIGYGVAPGTGPVSIEEATRGLRTASSELALLQGRLEAIDKAFGAEISRVGANAMMTDTERTQRVAELRTRQAEATDAVRELFGGKKETSDFERLQRQAAQLAASTEERAGSVDKLTRAEQQLVVVEDAYAQGLLKNVTPAQMAELKLTYDRAAAAEKEVREREKLKTAIKEATEHEARDMQQATHASAARDEELRKMQLHNEEIGLTSVELATLTQKRLDDAAAAKEQSLAYAGMYIASEQQWQLAVDQARQMRQKADSNRAGVDIANRSQSQDDRIRSAMDGQRAIDEQASRSAQAFETAVATGIMTGMRKGGGGLAQQLTRTFTDAIYTAMFTPIATQLARPFGQVGAAIGGGMSGGMGYQKQETYYEDAAGNVQVMPAGPGFGYYAAGALPFIAAGAQYAQGDRRGAILGGLGAAGGAAYGGPQGAMYGYMGGNMLSGIIGGFEKGDTRRSSRFSAGFGEDGFAYMGNQWFSGGEMNASLEAYRQSIAGQERNLIGNLKLSPDQIARVNASLAPVNQRSYDFGMEHTPWEQSEAFTQIRADRISAIAGALGRSIADLTRIMSLSADQWADAVKQMEDAVQGQRDTLAGAVRGLPGQLGISSLEDYQRNLAMSDVNAPLDRLATARGYYQDTLARARGGDLGAIQDFAGSAQSLLGVGRDVYASGAGYQDIFRDVNAALNELLGQQRGVQQDILRDVPTTIMQAANDQIGELRRGFTSVVDRLNELEAELRRWRNAA